MTGSGRDPRIYRKHGRRTGRHGPERQRGRSGPDPEVSCQPSQPHVARSGDRHRRPSVGVHGRPLELVVPPIVFAWPRRSAEDDGGFCAASLA